ncbi:hypothetical protein FQR65_LT12984 [Abscondita terminalis]|nr:hypothetical protein FQR65_LT12984 [Abscondita terminalis]
MKNSQQMSVESSNQDDMTLKALPPVGIKDNNLFPVDAVIENDLLDEDFHLHLSEDEDEEKNDNSAPPADETEVPQENEDEFLDKFVSGEKEVECNGFSDKLEDKLLNDADSEENAKVNGDSTGGEEVNEKTKSDSEQNEEEKKEKANADLLEDQIMDTEHLLQIVDKDQEDAEDTKDSCSSNSEESRDKGDETEAEGEKTDNMEEEMDTSKADDGVDIEENSLYKDDIDSELDKEYNIIANENEENVEVGEKEESAEASETVGISEKEETAAISEKECEEDDKMEEESVEKEEGSEAKEMEVSSEANEKVDDSEATKKEVSAEANEKEVSAEISDKGTVDEVASTENSKENEEMEVSGVDAEGEPPVDSAAKSSKRPLADPDSPGDSKKLKYSECESETRLEEPLSVPKLLVLNAISDFMQKKKLKKLTREDLEQFCLLKMCEAICHKSEIGELRHQLGVHEQMVDMWRKEAAQLTKQARDLEIVNKRLLHEVRLKNERDKPLIPVKITRSVGLQVRSDNNVIPSPKRRFSRPQPSTTVATTTTSKPNRFALTTTTTTTTSPKLTTPVNTVSKTMTNKVVTPTNKPLLQQPASKPKTILPKSPSSLLSKALQTSTSPSSSALPSPTNTSHAPVNNSVSTPSNNTNNSSSPNVHKSVPNQQPKSAKPMESKVIDLTDEDDKKPTPTTSSTTLPTTPTGVRIVSTPVKTANVVSSSGVVNPPRIMYVYNNQLIADSKIGTQKLMLKLNSNVIGQTNGVIATVSNGSTLQVSTANIRTTQVQPVRLSTPMTTVRTTAAIKSSVLKHPAPLPPPPITQMGIAARKPIPPKPHLSIRRSSGGIVLSWKMPYNLDNYEAIASYQLYAYQETTSAPNSDMWRKVGDVKALALPMACTLTQFADGNKYHFAVRAVDVQKRMGPFSDPEQILL